MAIPDKKDSVIEIIVLLTLSIAMMVVLGFIIHNYRP